MICKCCGQSFVLNAPHQKYCSSKCRYRANKRKLYQSRYKDGLCPQCGTEMTLKKENPSYCGKCQKYFQDRYYEKIKGEF